MDERVLFSIAIAAAVAIVAIVVAVVFARRKRRFKGEAAHEAEPGDGFEVLGSDASCGEAWNSADDGSFDEGTMFGEGELEQGIDAYAGTCNVAAEGMSAGMDAGLGAVADGRSGSTWNPNDTGIFSLDEPSWIGEKAENDGYNSPTMYSSIDVRTSCGFDFSEVVKARAARADAERPGASHVVYASGGNYLKAMDDMMSIASMFDFMSTAAGKALYGVEFPESTSLLGLLRPFGDKDSRIHGMQGVITLVVREVDADGVRMKYPVVGKAATSRRRAVQSREFGGMSAEFDSMVLDIAYLPNGRADIGRMVRWHGRKGYTCDFKWSRAEQVYTPMNVKVSETPGRWITVFP